MSDTKPMPKDPNEKRPVYKVQINYKSGVSIIARVYQFDMSTLLNGSRKAKWEVADFPRPLLMGVDDIESVWSYGEVTDV